MGLVTNPSSIQVLQDRKQSSIISVNMKFPMATIFLHVLIFEDFIKYLTKSDHVSTRLNECQSAKVLDVRGKNRHLIYILMPRPGTSVSVPKSFGKNGNGNKATRKLLERRVLFIQPINSNLGEFRTLKRISTSLILQCVLNNPML